MTNMPETDSAHTVFALLDVGACVRSLNANYRLLGSVESRKFAILSAKWSLIRRFFPARLTAPSITY
jgi:hypothetical protein